MTNSCGEKQGSLTLSYLGEKTCETNETLPSVFNRHDLIKEITKINCLQHYFYTAPSKRWPCCKISTREVFIEPIICYTTQILWAIYLYSNRLNFQKNNISTYFQSKRNIQIHFSEVQVKKLSEIPKLGKMTYPEHHNRVTSIF